MKIEKLSDNQIRCTLTRADLAERQLHLSELAYGTEKARSLFHDMMEQAEAEFGFEADNMPLMIEAIPSPSDSIILVITKVDDPEELDTRFSKFSPLPNGDAHSDNGKTGDKLEGAESVIDLLAKLKEKIHATQASITDTNPPLETTKNAETQQDNTSASEHKESDAKSKPPVRLFSFSSMDNVLEASHLLSQMYFGANTLYKDTVDNVYILALTQSTHSAKDFSRICNMLSEYGTTEHASGASLAFLEEHCKVMIANDAVQQLAGI